MRVVHSVERSEEEKAFDKMKGKNHLEQGSQTRGPTDLFKCGTGLISKSD